VTISDEGSFAVFDTAGTDYPLSPAPYPHDLKTPTVFFPFHGNHNESSAPPGAFFCAFGTGLGHGSFSPACFFLCFMALTAVELFFQGVHQV